MMKKALLAEISSITPMDAVEQRDLDRFRSLVEQECPIWRGAVPDEPDPHLVSYFPVIDPAGPWFLLGAHRKSGLWLPPGGHVEEGEHPRETVTRECQEELRSAADFLLTFPLFFTITQTKGLNPHHDMSLWYPLRGASDAVPDFDQGEYSDMRWFNLTDLPFSQTDPNFGRFVKKILDCLGKVTPNGGVESDAR